MLVKNLLCGESSDDASVTCGILFLHIHFFSMLLSFHSLQCLMCDVGEKGERWINQNNEQENFLYLQFRVLNSLFDETQNVWVLVVSKEQTIAKYSFHRKGPCSLRQYFHSFSMSPVTYNRFSLFYAAVVWHAVWQGKFSTYGLQTLDY